MGLLSVSSTFDCDPTETYIFFPSRENTMSRVQCPPPRSNPPPGRLGTITSRGPRAFRSPSWYGKRTTESVFAKKNVFGVCPQGIEGNAKRLLETAGEDLHSFALSVLTNAPEYLDAPWLAFRHEKVAVGCRANQPWVIQLGGVQFDFESRQHLRPCARWSRYQLGPVIYGRGRVGPRQVRGRGLVNGAGPLSAAVAKPPLAAQHLPATSADGQRQRRMADHAHT